VALTTQCPYCIDIHTAQGEAGGRHPAGGGGGHARRRRTPRWRPGHARHSYDGV